MWPDARNTWLEEYQGGYLEFAGEDERATWVSLRRYPSLCGPWNDPPDRDARHIASQAAQRTREIVLGDEAHLAPGYFRNRAECFRWLLTVTSREALRLVLSPRQIGPSLAALPEAQRCLLRWKYVDQLRDEEVARVLNLQGSRRAAFDADSARGLCLRAYQALCQRLAADLSLSVPPGVGGPQYSSLFPLFQRG